MTDATITNPSPIASVQEYFLPVNSSPVEKSNSDIFEDRMSSERGDCSLAPDLFIEDYIHIIPPLKPVRERGDTFLFSTPVPSIVGRRNGPARAAKAPAEMLSDQLQSKDIQRLF